MKNKIGWCNLTFNPVWGCRNHYGYCYARGMAKRFANQMAENECYYRYKNNIGTNPYTKRAFIKCTEKFRNFEPIFLHSQFDKKLPKKPQRIFVGSMSEIYYWQKEWINDVIEKVKQYPQHTFQFLTKHPEVYEEWIFPKNCWLGITITNNELIYCIEEHSSKVRFINIEPILEEIDIKTINYLDPNWIIVGAETGNRKGKIIPNGSWVFDILDFCNRTNTPLFIKDNLVKYYSEFRGYKEFPEVK